MPFVIKATVPWHYSVDSINNGGVTLVSLDKPEFRYDGVEVYVTSVKSWFTLKTGGTLPVDNIRVATCASGGQWHRSIESNIEWHKQVTWFIDPGSGNDENNGISSVTALKTPDELSRRLYDGILESDTTVTLMGTYITNAVVIRLSSMNKSKLRLIGIPLVMYSGILTSVTLPTINESWLLQDANIPLSWTSSSIVTTSNSGRLIRRVGSDCRSWVARDMGGKTIRSSFPTSIPENTDALTNTTAIWDAIDTYEVLILPQLQDITIENAPTIIQTIEFSNGINAVHAAGDNINFKLCSFVSNLVNDESADQMGFWNCCFTNGCNVSQPIDIQNGLLFGASSTQYIIESKADMTNSFIVLENASIVFSRANIDIGPSMYCFDCVNTAINVRNNSICGFSGGIHGLNNTNYIVNIRDANCKILLLSGGLLGTITAISSLVNPLRIIDTDYALSDPSLHDVSRSAGIIG